MIIAVVGSGGKTTLLKKMAEEYRCQGKRVFVTTTTHMFIEDGMILTDDADTIVESLKKNGYAVAGIPVGKKVKALSKETFETVCRYAEVVLVEADGSRRLPLKFPNASEPVIPETTDEIIIVCGLNAIEKRAKDVCHRLDLVKNCLSIEDHSIITAAHVQKLITEGYLKPLRVAYPNAKISIKPRHDGTRYQKAIAFLLENEKDVSVLRKEYFCPRDIGSMIFVDN